MRQTISRRIVDVNSPLPFHVLMVHMGDDPRSLLLQRCCFGGNRELLFRQQLVIIGQKLHLPHWRTVKTVVQTLLQIPCVFVKKLTRFGLRQMVDQTLHVMLVGWSAFAGPNETFASFSHYVTCLLTRSICSCGQGLKSNKDFVFRTILENLGINFKMLQLLSFPSSTCFNLFCLYRPLIK